MTATTNEGHRYALDVVGGKVLACEYVRLACQRYLSDLETCTDRGFHFDEAAATRAISLIEKLKHTKGEWAGQYFKLEPWQKFIIWNLYGWKRADGTRRFRQAYVEIARKNGKTALSAGIGIEMLFADSEARAEVYSAATTRQQARICFDDAKAIVRSTSLSKRIKVFSHALVHEPTGSRFAPLSSDSGALDGLSPSCGIVDEFHAHRDSGIYDVIISGMGARRQPLLFIITTAGFNKNGPCYEHRKMCINLLRGILEDDSIFAVIYTQDSEDEWDKPEMWIKSNPNLGISLSAEYLADRIAQAKNKPSEMVNTKTKNLNLWTEASAVWIPDAQWMKCHDPEFDQSTLMQCECWGGLDLSNTSDVTSLALLFREQGRYQVQAFQWIPEDTMMERFRKENINYPEWVSKGYVFVTPGNVIDREFIHATILELAKKYKIQSIAYDRWGATDTSLFLQDNGIMVNPFGQGYASMSGPSKKLEEIVGLGLLEHFNNPVLRWMLANVEIQRDPAGNIKPDKGKSRNKIDGIVALIMSIGEQMTMKAEPNPYESRGLIEL